MTFAGAILEFKGSIQYIKRTFIEIISLIKHHNITTFALTVKVKSGSARWPMQKIFLGSRR